MKPPPLPPSDVVMKVAQAIFEARVDKLPACIAMREMTDHERVTYTRMARAALRAMAVTPP
jgi:hypothetical protein